MTTHTSTTPNDARNQHRPQSLLAYEVTRIYDARTLDVDTAVGYFWTRTRPFLSSLRDVESRGSSCSIMVSPKCGSIYNSLTVQRSLTTPDQQRFLNSLCDAGCPGSSRLLLMVGPKCGSIEHWLPARRRPNVMINHNTIYKLARVENFSQQTY